MFDVNDDSLLCLKLFIGCQTHTWMGVCASGCLSVFACLFLLAFRFHFSYVVLSSSLSCSDWSSAQRLLLSAERWVNACVALSCFCLCHLCCLELVFCREYEGLRLLVPVTRTNAPWLIKQCPWIALFVYEFLLHTRKKTFVFYVWELKWIKNATPEDNV